MRTLMAVVVVAVVLSCSASFGAIVTFNNPLFDRPFVDLKVYITGTEMFGAVDLILQSACLDLSGTWTPAVSWDALVDNGNLGMTGAAHERWVGGAMTSVSRYVGPSVLLGTLTIPTTALPLGAFTVSVDGNADGLSAVGYLGGADPLVGGGCISIIPEPATLALLALGGVLIARRRRA